MTVRSRNNLTKSIVLVLTALLLVLVLSMQFIAAPAAPVLSQLPAIAETGKGDVKVSFRDAETGLFGDDYLLTDKNVSSSSANGAATPAAGDRVSVVISLEGTPMMQFATARGLTVAQALATYEGRRNFNELQSIRKNAENGVSKYISEKRYDYSTIMNAFSATVRYGDIAAIERNPYVRNVIVSNTYNAPQTVTENYVEVYESGIFDSSSVGYDGTGTVVAVVDTGTDYTHEVFDMELDPDTVAITKDDVAAVVDLLTATSLSATPDPDIQGDTGDIINEDDLYIKTKLPFAYDYADSDPNVYPHNSHGTHVAGIIAGKSDEITGVAIGAQIATFKVFSDYRDGASTEAILAALNDAVTLGVDAINMSLGTSCGFSREVDEEETNKVYGAINDAGICLVVAASNDASSANGSRWGNTNLASNPDSGTVGSPGSYTASLAVGSVSGVKTKYFTVDEKEVYFAESRLVGKTDPNDFVGGLLQDREQGEFEFVVIPGIGLWSDYTDIDVEGKIAVIRRGSNSFEEKVKTAAELGAIGAIVYNNVSGTVGMSVGTKEVIPSCFVTMDYATPLVAMGTGTIKLSVDYLAGPFMSDFSSWGVLPNLQLSPDITAHGGEIYSAVAGGDVYDRYSGTSMASPNLAGALILVRQYVKENNENYTTNEVRDESYSRMMSTATIVRNEEGNPYSPRKQGAGLADISNSINTKAFITVDGSNKPKLSLGDDPDRSGIYDMKFNIVNVSANAISYNINPYVMTETMSSDGRTVAEKAYMFEDTVNSYSVSAKRGNATISGNTVSLSGYGEATVSVRIALSAADKAYLDKNFINGMYVEGYIRLDSNNRDSIDLSIPYLAFYGNWADAPMLDVSEYEVGASAVDDSVVEQEKLKADVYGTLPYAGFKSETAADGMGYYGMGAYLYIPASGYTAPATQEKYAALTNNPEGNYLFYMVNAGLLRGAKRVVMEIRNSITGELIWSDVDYNARKSHASGGQQVGGSVMVELDIRDFDLPNNSTYTFKMDCYLDWTGSYSESREEINDADYVYGNKNTFSFQFTVDNEAPELSDVAVRKEGTGSSARYYLDLTAYDNHYLQGFSIYTYGETTPEGLPTSASATPLADGVVPAETTTVKPNFNSDTTLTMDITNYWSTIQANDGKMYVTFFDYARNTSSHFVKIEKESDLQITKTRTARDEYTFAPNAQLDLKQYITVTANTFDDVDEDDKSYVEGYWTDDLIWESSNAAVAEVRDGLVTGLSVGDAVITVRTPNVPAFDENDTKHCLKFTVHISGTPKDDIDITGIELSPGAIMLERGETTKITAKIEPYNATVSSSLTWTSTSSTVEIVSIEDDGMSVIVRAVDSGASTVRATVNGTRISGYSSVRVHQEFEMYESIYLRSYTGRGGDYVNEAGETEHNVVDIPDDIGVVYIYPQAFAGNEYIEKVIIPEGVTTIMRAAFVNCKALKEVVLPSTLETLEMGAFAGCTNLERINLKDVKTIGEQAFISCESLDNIDLLSCTYIDRLAFMSCKSLSSLDLSRVGTVGGGAFGHCSGLETLVIPSNVSMNYYAPYSDGGAFSGCENLRSVVIESNSVGMFAFSDCTSLESVTFVNSVETIDQCAFYGCTALREVNFKSTAYKIAARAFYGCSALTSFKLPNGLTVLEQAAFYGCTSLTTITVSSGALLTDIEWGAFYGGGNSNTQTAYITVSEFIVEDGNRYLASVDGVLYDRAMKKLVAFPTYKRVTSFKVPGSVTTIGSAAFSLANYLRSVDLTNVKYIESYAFFSTNIGTVSGFDKVEYVGERAFNSSNITSLPVTDKTLFIGDYAFAGCDNLSSDNRAFVASANLEYLGEGAFFGSALKSVSFENSKLKEVGAGAFNDCADLTDINFGSLESISDAMFGSCSALTDVVIPDTIKTIGAGAFALCENLASVSLPSGLTEIADEAFGKTKLTTVDLPTGVTRIGDRAFMGTRLTNIDLKNVTVIGAGAFAGAPIVTVSSQFVKEIGADAFKDCEALTTVNLPAAEHIGDNAFKNCLQLSSVSMENVLTVGAHAFDGCATIANLVIPKAEFIGDGAFYNARLLAEITFGSVKSVGRMAFYGTAVEQLDFTSALNKVADGAFTGALGLTAINVAEGNPKYFSRDGVLYSVNDSNFYTLVSYPAGKTDAEYSVLDRTIKLGAYAFNANDSLLTLNLPAHLQVIGVSSMSGMASLTQLNIKAVSAPILESEAVSGEDGSFVNIYNNFKFSINAGNAIKSELTVTVPANSIGYNNRIWKAYVGVCKTVSDKIHATSGALDFIERVNALPAASELTRDDAVEINALLRLYRMLDNSQRRITEGNYTFTENGNSVDSEYYTALLGGKNYYQILTAAQETVNNLPIDPPVPPTPPTPEKPAESGIKSNVPLLAVLIVALVLVCAALAYAVTVIIKRSR